ncbi:hypothetical protein HOLleu_19448 [Holothuria leucospilota]|uniref:Uncharacterized protein n=1 Tax=Holothuria leucospilota TaxID=206669 RepID=A0A9Q1BZV3_HOLLE|nr:hypothetical protein HOLleu_19448 [Holothuria leucospilota]
MQKVTRSRIELNTGQTVEARRARPRRGSSTHPQNIPRYSYRKVTALILVTSSFVFATVIQFCALCPECLEQNDFDVRVGKSLDAD